MASCSIHNQYERSLRWSWTIPYILGFTSHKSTVMHGIHREQLGNAWYILTRGCRCTGAGAEGWPASVVGGRGGRVSSSGPVAGWVDSRGQYTTRIPYQWTVIITNYLIIWDNQSCLLLIILLIWWIAWKWIKRSISLSNMNGSLP